ncbi:MAG: F0F1 ATP synthase subunit B' [Proteobacteria bacterium]|nr:F0F1 ATP synthase subunit B' [Pseudomonadota bacterium]
MAQTTTETTAEGTPVSTSEGTEAHGGKAAFPPLDQSTFPSQIFWLILFFGALYFLMSRFALPRLGAIIENRQAKIDGDLARAQALKEDTEAAVKAYEKALADARSSANDIARETREAVAKDVDGEQHKLDAALAAKIADAEGKIAKSKAKALESVEEIASDAAAEIVASLTGAKVTKAAIAKALKG